MNIYVLRFYSLIGFLWLLPFNYWYEIECEYVLKGTVVEQICDLSTLPNNRNFK